MPPSIALQHLTFATSDGDTAQVLFSPRLTVVHGASDTGKSFICSAIDYMFRGRLKAIPEAESYTSVLLGLQPSGSESLTLARSLDGGDAFLYNYDIRRLPKEPPSQVLTTSNAGRKGIDSLSSFLLRLIAMEGKTILRKLDGTSRGLSVRDIAHLAIINETKMQSPVPPALQGQFVTTTPDLSVMKLLLTGEDEVPSEDLISEVRRRSTNAQRELLVTIITELRDNLSESPVPDVLERRIKILDADIERATRDLAGLMTLKHAAARAVDDNRKSRSEISARAEELQQLSARFALLANQYESDLRRLALLFETGDLLNLFRADICVFCGTHLSEHQGEHQADEVTVPLEFGLAVEIERVRVTSLLGDLRGTIGDVEAEFDSAQARVQALDFAFVELTEELARSEEAAQPEQTNLAELFSARNQATELLARWAQVRLLEDRMPEAVVSRTSDATRGGGAALEAASRELADKLKAVLKAWDFPGADTVRLDPGSYEPIVDDRRRSDRGKGVRAMQHAAMTVALAEYCIERDLPHPGFVVLDSPLVTYREPEADDAQTTPAVPDAFYRYLANEFPGQAVVLENTPPPSLGGDAQVVHLTGITGSGRFGFF